MPSHVFWSGYGPVLIKRVKLRKKCNNRKHLNIFQNTQEHLSHPQRSRGDGEQARTMNDIGGLGKRMVNVRGSLDSCAPSFLSLSPFLSLSLPFLSFEASVEERACKHTQKTRKHTRRHTSTSRNTQVHPEHTQTRQKIRKHNRSHTSTPQNTQLTPKGTLTSMLNDTQAHPKIPKRIAPKRCKHT